MSEAGRRLAKFGSLLQLAPVTGFAVSVREQMQIMDRVSQMYGLPPEVFAGMMNDARTAAYIGLAIGLPGLVMIALALWKYRFRARWFYYVCYLVGIVLVLRPYIGSAIGISLIAYLVLKRDEFVAGGAPA